MADNQPASPAPQGGPLPPAGGAQRYYPPTGTYPSPAEAPAVSSLPPPPPQPERKSRRVGVYTMALCLIAVGVVLLLSVFLPEMDYLFIVRLFPLALVLLGVELLVAAVRHRHDKLRIDFLTVLICLMLIGGSVLAAAVPQVIRTEVQGSQVGERLEAELETASHTVLAQAGVPKVSQLDWYVGLNHNTFSTGMTPQDIRPEHTVQFRMGLLGVYADAGAFAADCRAALRLLRPLVPHLDYISFYSVDPANPGRGAPLNGTQYDLWLDGPYQIDDESLPLEDYVEVYIYGEDLPFDEDDAYEDEP